MFECRSVDNITSRADKHPTEKTSTAIRAATGTRAPTITITRTRTFTVTVTVPRR